MKKHKLENLKSRITRPNFWRIETDPIGTIIRLGIMSAVSISDLVPEDSIRVVLFKLRLMESGPCGLSCHMTHKKSQK